MWKLFCKKSDLLRSLKFRVYVLHPKLAACWLMRRKPLSSRQILLLILGFFLLLLLWAGLAPIDRVVRVEGNIIPAGRMQEIQHLEGGLIASINVTEGQAVKRGDTLMTIDGTIANADMGDITTKLNAALMRKARLEAETNQQDHITFPPELAESLMAKAEQSLFEARRTKIQEEIAVHHTTITQRQNDIAQAEQQWANLSEELITAQKRVKLELAMAAKGAASQMEVLEAQSRAQRLKTEISSISSAIPKLKAAIAEEEARIQAGEAEFKSSAHTDLVATIEDLTRFQQLSKSASDRLQRTDIKAPSDGIINHIRVNTVGGVVRGGETLIELTPDTRQVLIEAKALPRDRGYLREGLPAQVRISAYDSSELGALRGEVTEVSADSIQTGKDMPYYVVKILIKNLPKSYTGHNILPGMTITADIAVGQRTVLAYLLSPVSKFSYKMFRDPR